MEKIFLEDKHILNFGSYANHSIEEISNINPEYLLWLCRESTNTVFRLSDRMERKLRLKGDDNIIDNFLSQKRIKFKKK